MIYMEPTEYDFQDKADFDSDRPRCVNCETTEGWLTEYRTDDAQELLLCEDCCNAEAAIEREADQLARIDSDCPVRNAILDAAGSTRRLVVSLRAHDQGQCVHCATKSEGRAA